MNDQIEVHKIPLNICIPTPLSLAKPHQKRQSSLEGLGLLYQTYDDYFNMEEDISRMTPSLFSASSTSLNPLSTDASKNKIPATLTGFNEFFFVLSASSPCDATSTPISPFKKGDIPDALSHLLPQPRPSNSLLDVVSITRQTEPLRPPPPGENSAPTRTEPVSHHARVASKVPKKIRPLPPRPNLLCNSTAAVPMSLAFTEPSNIPTSSCVEISSIPLSPKLSVSSSRIQALKPWHRTDSARISDPQSEIHSHGSPLPYSASAFRSRLRKYGWTDVVGQSPRVPLASSSAHIRGRSSPFPAPIQYDFAPSSVPGSEGTPYCYF